MKTTIHQGIATHPLTQRLGRAAAYAAIGLAGIFASPTYGQTNGCYTAPAGLVGWWRAEGDAVDFTGAHSGSFPFGSAFASGVVGQAFDFDGSYRRVSIPDSPAFQLTNAMTLEAWVYPRAYGGFITFRGDNRGGLDNWTLDTYDPGFVKFTLIDPANNAATVRASLALNQWQHVAATWDHASGDLKIYVNGVLGAQANSPLVPIGVLEEASEPAIGIGNHGGTFHQFPFNGLIDELGIYNRALNSNEVANIYAAGSAGKCQSNSTNPPPVITGVPAIINFSPKSALIGSQIIITGTNFSPIAASNIVYFGATRAVVSAATPTNLVVILPPGATHDPISVTVNGRTALSPTAFLPTFSGSGTNISTGSFAAGQNMTVADGPLRSIIADLDNDGKPDLIEANAYAHNVSIFRSISVVGTLDASSFAPRVDLPSLGGTDSPRCMAVADVDGDGKLDILVGDQATSGIFVYRNISTPGVLNAGSFAAPVGFAAGSYPHGLRVADLDGDGLPEILVANYSGGFVSILKNTGSAGSLTTNSFAPQYALVTGPGPTDVGIADLNGDGRPDLVATAFDGSQLSLFRNVASPTTAVSNWFILDASLPALAGSLEITLADLDGDAKSDLVVATVHGYAISVYRNQAGPGVFTTNSFAARVDYSTPGWVHTISVADFNGDAKPDLAAVGELDSYLGVFQNQSSPGNISLAPRVDFATGWNAWGVAAGDLDGDNRADIVFANAYEDTLTFYRNIMAEGSSTNPPSGNCVAIPNGAISWWRGEGSALDDIHSNHGSIVGGVTTVPGKVGNGFGFDGTGYVVVPHDPSLNCSNALTIELWYNSAQNNNPDYGLIDKRVGFVGANFGINVIAAAGLGIYYDDLGVQDGDDGGSSFETSRYTPIPAPGVFHHLAATYWQISNNLVQVQTYLNGQNVRTRYIAGNLANTVNTAPVTIGATAQGMGEFFKGVIDEVTLYNRVLTPAEIQSIYAADTAGKCASTNPPLLSAGIPVIISFNPPVATSGVEVFLTGTNFSPLAASNIVYFGAVRANVIAANPTNLMVIVPVGATYAPITVVVDGLMGLSSSSFLPTFNGAGQTVNANTFAPRQDLTADYGNYQSVIADFDGDGKPDLGIGNGYGHILSLFRNISTPGSNVFEPRIVLPIVDTTDSPAGFISADMDCDGRMDLLFTDAANSRVGIMRNVSVPGTLTTDSFAPPVYFATGSVCFRVRVHDLDGDGRPDVVTCNQGNSTLSVLRNLGSSGALNTNSFAPAFSLATGANPHDFCIQDFDGDGKPDLAVANDQSSFVSLFKNVSVRGELTPGSFAPAINLPTDSGQLIVNAGDVDGDGRPELLVGGRANKLSVFRNLGSGALSTNSFAAPVDFNVPGWLHNVVLSDINGDGKPDPVAVGELDSYLAVFQNQSIPGTFNTTSLATRVDYATGWNAWSVSVGDLDGDSRPDVAFCNNYETFASIYRNALSDPPPGSCVPAPSGLVASWRAEGNALDSASGSSGALENVSFTTGVVGQAFVFNPATGPTRVSIPDRPEFVLTNSLSIEGWIYPTGPSWTIFWRGDNRGGLDPYFLQMNPDEGNILQFIIEQESPNTAAVLGTTPLAFNQWYHIAATLDDATGTMRIYTNGVLAAETSTTIRPFANLIAGADASIGIGNLGEHWFDHPFAGNIDEISLYSRALAQSEVQAIYSAGSAGKCPLPAAAPNITQQPQSITNNVNTTASFAVFATGNPAPDYQWFFAGNPLAGQTSASLLLDNIQPGQAGPYFVTVSNSFGAVTSSIATLTVLTYPPGITKQPTNFAAIVTTAASFSVQATGSMTLTYQWLFNGSPLAGKTATTLSFPSVQFSNAGNYSVIITNPYGAVTSSVATLIVNPLPPCAPVHDGLVSWWKGENNMIDNWDSNNAGPFGNYQPGKVGRAFITPLLTVADSASLRMTNGLTIEAWINPSIITGTRVILSKYEYPFSQPASSQSAYLLGMTNNGAPFFALTPNGSTRTNATLFATNTLPVNQWSHVAATYDGAIMRLYINGTPVAQTNYAGRIFPGTAPLGIGGFPSGTSSPWQFSGLLDEISIYNRALSPAEIQTIVAADLTGKCLAPPVITQQPQDQAVPLGEDVKLTATITGSRPLTYQWYLNGPATQFTTQRITGATNAFLVLEKVKTNNTGAYTLRVTNSVGFDLSAPAQITLLPAPTCTDILPGLISWWTGDANTLDAMGLNSIATYSPTSYPTGKVASAFTFNGVNSRIQINNSASLNFSSNANFSIEMWIRATNAEVQLGAPYPNVPLFEKRTTVTTGWVGYSLSLNQGRLAFAIGTPGTAAPGATSNYIASGPDLRDAMFHHVAVTVNRSATNGGVLYVDGVPVLTFNPKPLNVSLVNTSPLFIGAPTVTLSNSYFAGLIDEPAIYNRDLTAAEILSIRTAGAAGRCKAPPFIVTQPVGGAVVQGSNFTLSVTASGTPALRYQWRKNVIPVNGATNATLNLSNVTASIAGTYSVIVSNAFGSVISSNAVVALNRLPIANADALNTPSNTPAVFPAAKLTLNDTDADGDPLTVTSVNTNSNNSHSGTVSLVAGVVTYSPLTNYVGNDIFTYSIADGRGGTATGTVMVTVGSGGAAPLNIVFGPVIDGGQFVVRFAGIPGLTYTIESAPTLNGTWVKVANVTAPMTDTGLGIGVFEFREPVGGEASRYYRTIYPSY